MGQDTHQWRSTDPAYLALGCGTSRSTSYGSVCWILELPGGIVMHSLARHCRTCICIRNSFIHLLINRRWQPTTLGDLWMLDLRTWTWQQLPNENGPEPRSGIVVALVQMMSDHRHSLPIGHVAVMYGTDEMYVFGGENAQGKLLNDLWTYSFSTLSYVYSRRCSSDKYHTACLLDIDTTNDRWTRIQVAGTLPSSRMGSKAATITSNR